ncbi:MAG: redoxin domain-containing protein [Proteobacteria bacterium]|nr:redoxin domain-containing protein [Pseudomonadota bacterium]
MPGRDAPDFSATDIAGKPVKLSELRGQYVVLEWTNHLCPFVKKHYGSGNMQALQKKYAAQGVVWLSIISSAPGKEGYVTDEEAAQIAKDKGSMASRIIRDADGTIGHLYGAKATPHMFIDGQPHHPRCRRHDWPSLRSQGHAAYVHYR